MSSFTYHILADNCNMPKITFEIKNIPKNTAKYVAGVLGEAFRKVDVICENTGEVVYNIYHDGDFLTFSISEIEAISVLKTTLTD